LRPDDGRVFSLVLFPAIWTAAAAIFVAATASLPGALMYLCHVLLLSNPVSRILDRVFISTVRGTEEHIPSINPMTDNLTTAVGAFRGQGMDGTFETVENMSLTTNAYFKKSIVVIATYFAGSHAGLLVLVRSNRKNVQAHSPALTKRSPKA